MTVALLALLAAAAPSPSCTFETAVPASTREMAREPDKWLDRCVRLDGLVEGYVFYEDVAGLYRREASDKEDRPNDGWLGLYFADEDRRYDRLRRAAVVGIVDDCRRDYEEAAAEAGPDVIIMMLGYCHYQGGLVLWNVAVKPGPKARVLRQTGEAARAAFGDLIAATDADPVSAEAAALIDAYVEAFRSADAAALQRLVEPYDFLEPEKPAGKARLRRLLLGEEGAFRPFRDGRAEMRPAYFREKLPAGEEGPPHWLACFCKVADCTASWPIAAIDAKALARRPYACLRIHPDLSGERELRLGVETEGRNFEVPPA